ncbi:hypothetical protein XENOCAPTIV_028471, partial [Xenoophorus captivus]
QQYFISISKPVKYPRWFCFAPLSSVLTSVFRLVVVYRAAPGFSAMALLAYVKSLFILQLLMGFVFVVSGLIINFIQLCTCILWPINRQLYRRINCRLSYSLWSREYFMLLLCAARCLDSM